MLGLAPIAASAISELYFTTHTAAATGVAAGSESTVPLIDYVLDSKAAGFAIDVPGATFIVDRDIIAASVADVLAAGPVTWGCVQVNPLAADTLQTEITTFTATSLAPAGAIIAASTVASMAATMASTGVGNASVAAVTVTPQQHVSAGGANNSASVSATWGVQQTTQLTGATVQSVTTQFTSAQTSKATAQDSPSTNAIAVTTVLSKGVGDSTQSLAVGFQSKITEQATQLSSTSGATTIVLRTGLEATKAQANAAATMQAVASSVADQDAADTISAGTTITRSIEGDADAQETQVSTLTIQRHAAESVTAAHESKATSAHYPSVTESGWARIVAKFRKRTYLS